MPQSTTLKEAIKFFVEEEGYFGTLVQNIQIWPKIRICKGSHFQVHFERALIFKAITAPKKKKKNPDVSCL